MSKLHRENHSRLRESSLILLLLAAIVHAEFDCGSNCSQVQFINQTGVEFDGSTLEGLTFWVFEEPQPSSPSDNPHSVAFRIVPQKVNGECDYISIFSKLSCEACADPFPSTGPYEFSLIGDFDQAPFVYKHYPTFNPSLISCSTNCSHPWTYPRYWVVGIDAYSLQPQNTCNYTIEVELGDGCSGKGVFKPHGSSVTENDENCNCTTGYAGDNCQYRTLITSTPQDILMNATETLYIRYRPPGNVFRRSLEFQFTQWTGQCTDVSLSYRVSCGICKIASLNFNETSTISFSPQHTIVHYFFQRDNVGCDCLSAPLGFYSYTDFTFEITTPNECYFNFFVSQQTYQRCQSWLPEENRCVCTNPSIYIGMLCNEFNTLYHIAVNQTRDIQIGQSSFANIWFNYPLVNSPIKIDYRIIYGTCSAVNHNLVLDCRGCNFTNLPTPRTDPPISFGVNTIPVNTDFKYYFYGTNCGCSNLEAPPDHSTVLWRINNNGNECHLRVIIFPANATCSSFTETNICDNGICTSASTCRCNPGYSGYDCSYQLVEPEEIVHRGTAEIVSRAGAPAEFKVLVSQTNTYVRINVNATNVAFNTKFHLFGKRKERPQVPFKQVHFPQGNYYRKFDLNTFNNEPSAYDYYKSFEPGVSELEFELKDDDLSGIGNPFIYFQIIEDSVGLPIDRTYEASVEIDDSYGIIASIIMMVVLGLIFIGLFVFIFMKSRKEGGIFSFLVTAFDTSSTNRQRNGNTTAAAKKPEKKEPHIIAALAVVTVSVLLGLLLNGIVVIFNLSFLHAILNTTIPQFVDFTELKEALYDVLGNFSNVYQFFVDIFEYLNFLAEIGINWNCGGFVALLSPLIFLSGVVVIFYILKKEILFKIAIRMQGSGGLVQGTARKGASQLLSRVVLYVIQTAVLVFARLVTTVFSLNRSCSDADREITSVARTIVIVILSIFIAIAVVTFGGFRRNYDKGLGKLIVGVGGAVKRLVLLTVGVWNQDTAEGFAIVSQAAKHDNDPDDDDNQHEEVIRLTAQSRSLIWILIPGGALATKFAEASNDPPLLVSGIRTSLELKTSQKVRAVKWGFNMIKFALTISVLFTASTQILAFLFATLLPGAVIDFFTRLASVYQKFQARPKSANVEMTTK